MILNILLISTAIAGISMIWRKWLHDHPQAKISLKSNAGVIGKAVTCGICSVYWLTFIILLLINPLAEWSIPLRWDLPVVVQKIAVFLTGWMTIAWLATTGRFILITLFETVKKLEGINIK